MAPEQFDDAGSTAAVDIYGLGCIAHEMLTGVPQIQTSNFAELLEAKLAYRLPSGGALSRLAPDTFAFLDTCLRRDPAERVLDFDRLAEWAGPVDPQHVALAMASR